MDEPTEKEIDAAKEACIADRERAFAQFSEGVDLFAQHLTSDAIVDARRLIRLMYDMGLGSAELCDILTMILSGDAEGAKREVSDL